MSIVMYNHNNIILQGKDYLPSWEFCAAMKPDGSPDHRLQLSTLDKENSSNIIENNINLLKNKLSIATRKQINQYYQVSLLSVNI